MLTNTFRVRVSSKTHENSNQFVTYYCDGLSANESFDWNCVKIQKMDKIHFTHQIDGLTKLH